MDQEREKKHRFVGLPFFLTSLKVVQQVIVCALSDVTCSVVLSAPRTRYGSASGTLVAMHPSNIQASTVNKSY